MSISVSCFYCKENSSIHQVDKVSEKLQACWIQYRVPGFEKMRFSPEQYEESLHAICDSFGIEHRIAGFSIENRPIHLVTVGNGPIKVYLWSQMHGDEPTASMAILDMLYFLHDSSREWKSFRDLIKSSCTLYFLPIVNPDGAAAFKRRNALDIDLNRDALRKQCPEAKILWSIRDSIQPHWGFNLHDQQIYYAAGRLNRYPATISFLAPPPDEIKSKTSVRKEAMQLIVDLNNMLQNMIPNHVARYDDTFEPRAFGDNFQASGMRTILVESGGMHQDPEKQKIRQLNFTLLLYSLHQIATKGYSSANPEHFFNIPENSVRYFDLLVSEVTIPFRGMNYLVDIGWKNKISPPDSMRKVSITGNIDDQGDLHNFSAYEQIDAKGYTFQLPQVLQWNEKKLPASIEKYVRNGTPIIRSKSMFNQLSVDQVPWVISPTQVQLDTFPFIGRNPIFYLKKDNHLRYLILDGQCFDLDKMKQGSIDSIYQSALHPR